MKLIRDRNGYAIIGSTSGQGPGRFDSRGGRENSTRGGADARLTYFSGRSIFLLRHCPSFNKKI